MKKLLLTGIAALLLATGAAHAAPPDHPLDEILNDHWAQYRPPPESQKTGRPEIDDYQTWTTNGQSCRIIKHFRPGDSRLVIERGTRVSIDAEEIADLEKAIHNLKICSKFYECIALRDGVKAPPKGQKRPQHCRESMWNGWKAIP
jgi:hypothetical protein